jgi:hypothetical protein
MEVIGFSGVFVVIIIGILLYIITQLRKVVPTNEVHVVQRKKNSSPYGK